MKSFRSIRLRMSLGFVVLIAALMALGSWIMIALSDQAAEHEYRSALRNVARHAADLASDPAKKSELLAYINEKNLRERGVGIQIMSSGGDILYKAGELPATRPGARRDPNWRMEPGRGKGLFALAARPAGPLNAELSRTRALVIGLDSLAAIAIAIGAWFLVGKTLRPIGELAHQSASVSADNLHTRLVPPSNDIEVVDLVSTLNGLLDRVHDSALAKGRFYAAASHELRTPLQALSGHLETALSRERSSDEYRGALVEAHEQTGRLTSLVADLLLLHQIETNRSVQKEDVPINGFVDETIDHLRPLAEAREVSVELEPGRQETTHAAPSHVEIVVRNLIENAVLYAPSQGTVKVSLCEEKGRPKLLVTNVCELAQGESAERLFEPFYRVDESRNARSGGNGLGLAICRSIADVNGWRLELQAGAGQVSASLAF